MRPELKHFKVEEFNAASHCSEAEPGTFIIEMPNGEYKTFVLNPEYGLDFRYYQSSKKHYLFVFGLNYCTIFLRKTIAELEKDNNLVSDTTNVYVVNKTGSQEFKLSPMIFKLFKDLKDEVVEKQFRHAKIITENLVDMSLKSNIMGMIYFEQRGHESYDHSNYKLIMLDIDDWSKHMICIEPPT